MAKTTNPFLVKTTIPSLVQPRPFYIYAVFFSKYWILQFWYFVIMSHVCFQSTRLVGSLLLACNAYICIVLPTGGWSLVNISGDGSEWGLNSIQFIREKMLGSKAFYNLFIDVNDAFSMYTLGVCVYTMWHIVTNSVFLLLYTWAWK